MEVEVIRYLAIMFSLVMTAGCATQNLDMQQMQTKNRELASELNAARQNISALEENNARLDAQVKDLTDITGRLQVEKDVRVEESGSLRRGVRDFVKTQSAALREFSKQQDFLDYVGSELIERQGNGGKDLTLIDTRNQINAPGTLVGVRGLFSSPCTLSLVLLRPVDEKWVAIWTTGPLQVAAPGLQTIDLAVPVSVTPGDLTAWVFTGPVGVSFDTGTGGTLTEKKPLTVGDQLKKATPRDMRSGSAYSIGVLGILDW